MPINIGEPWMWAAFSGFLITMLALDLFVFGGRKAHRVSIKEALAWVIAWSSMALLFSELLFWYLNNTYNHEIAQTKTLEFLTGYLIEQSLSVDNMFVFVMIFKYFAVPAEFQRRVLLYGVLGAIIMRALMIFAGVWLVSEFAWVLYIFGIFLLVTGIKMLIFADHEPDLDKNVLLRWIKNHMRITNSYHGERFFIKQKGVLWATPLFLVLILIETTDLIFAIDSIPAIFTITTDPFIIFTSNMFAIMGLRALYFLLAHMADRFQLLKYGLAIVLIFIGGKMLIMPWFHIPITWSLTIVGSIILISIVLSLTLSKNKSQAISKKEAAKMKAYMLPEPSETIYDSDGRLISISLNSKEPLPANTNNTWLVAIDGSEHSLEAAKAILKLSFIPNEVIHLVNVQPWLNKEVAQSELKRLGWEATTQTRELLNDNNISWCLHIIMGESAESIVALAQRLGCKGIVIGSKGLGATKALLLGSVAYQVIHLSTISVLVVR